MAKILIVEDDRILRELVKAYLTVSEHVVDVATCAEHGLNLMKVNEYDLIILDWMLPDVPGIELCRNYRNHGGQAPILFLTAKSDKRDKAAGLDAGADDYLVKPFEQVEFQARVRALLRRRNPWQGSLLTFDGLEINTSSQTVRRSGRDVKLRPKEYALLELLVKNAGKSFSAESLFRKLWDSDSETSVETVRMHVMSLRKKLEAPGQPPLITSSRGLGYKISAAESDAADSRNQPQLGVPAVYSKQSTD